MNKKSKIYLTAVLLGLVIVSGCSTRKNTAGTRFYHSLTTRYNVYFNGNEAFKEGLIALEDGSEDNYMERIPLYQTNDTATGEKIGGSEFDRAIEKSQKAIRQHSIKRKPVRRPGRTYTDEYRQWLNRREFNPFLHNAWMLMGKAQYYKGDLADAIATFSYVIRLYENQPDIKAEAGIWLARSYTGLKWYYEAEDVLSKVNNDSLPNKFVPSYSSAYGNLLVEQERYREAVPHLTATIKNEKNRKQKVRQYYLLGQVYQQLEDNTKAYNTYGKVIRMNPVYELELNARIKQTEVMPVQNSDKIISRLRRMSRNGKNKEYLDQIYYALGNVYLKKQDTIQAITEYQKGVEKSTRNGIEKGMLQLKLGDVLWTIGRYKEAQSAYSDAISLIDKTHPDFTQLTKRSEVLDELVKYADAVQLQDSLQYLASLSEEDRIEAVIKVMEEEARKEKEAREAEERKLLEEERAVEGEDVPFTPPTVTSPVASGEAAWYFYNPQIVVRGKVEFERTWGRRKLEDNWRRKNKTVVNLDEFEAVNYDEPEETEEVAELSEEGSTTSEETTDDGKDIQYYLRQIPLTEEAMAESNAILSEALYNLGIIFKDKLGDFPSAEHYFTRLLSQFPKFQQNDNALYHLFLMYSLWDKPQEASTYKNKLLTQYPYSKYSLILSDPEFVQNALYGKHREDSLYAQTYGAWQTGSYHKIHANYKISSDKYPAGKHRPKFIFFNAMAHLQEGDTEEFLTGLKEVVTTYPENEITDIAAHILKGLQEGRTLAGTSNPLGTIWERRLTELKPEESVPESELPPFDTKRDTRYFFMLAYEDGKVNENLLLYEIAKYNFSSFVVKNYDITFEHEGGIGMLQIRPFINYNEARQYMHQLYNNKDMGEKLKGLRAIVISEENYELLVKFYSFDKYEEFYNEELASDFLQQMSLDYIDFEEVDTTGEPE